MNQKLKNYVRDGFNTGVFMGASAGLFLGGVYYGISYYEATNGSRVWFPPNDLSALENAWTFGSQYVITATYITLAGAGLGTIGGAIGYGYNSLESKIFGSETENAVKESESSDATKE